MNIELQKVSNMENALGGWGPHEDGYQVTFSHNGNSIVAPYFPSELPENELAILDWLIENHYNDDNDLSIYIDHIAKLPAEEMKLEICGEVFYSKQLKPIFEKHFGG